MPLSEQGRRYLKFVLLNLVIATAYFLTAKFGLALSGTIKQVTLVWPPTGIALGSLILWGSGVIPAITLGAFLANLTTGEVPLLAISIALGNTLEAMGGVYLLKKLGFSTYLNSAKNVFLFISVGALLSPVISATIGVSSLIYHGIGDWAGFGKVWFTWWLGDLMGALFFTPLILAWHDKKSLPSLSFILKTITILTLLTLISLLIFFPQYRGLSIYPIEYLIFPLLSWTAFRLGTRGTTLSTLLIATVAVWATVMGHGPFAIPLDIQAGLISLQFFLVVLATTSLIISSVIKEKSAALQEREYDYRKYRALIENSSDVFILIDQTATAFYASPTVRKVVGYTAEEYVGTNVFNYVHPEDRERLIQLFRDILLVPGKTITTQYRSLTKTGDWKWMEGTGTNLINDPGIRGIAISYRDIDERKKLEVVKTEFVTLAAHQLRTPLSTLRWYAEALRGMVKAKSKVSKYVDAIYLSIIKMNDLTNLLLHVSRIETGTFIEKKVAIDIKRSLDSVIHEFAIELAQKHLKLTPIYKHVLPPFITSPKVLQIILQNLVGNAVHYTLDGGSVTITLDIQQKQLFIQVQDTGIGIPEIAQPKIFTKLFRAANSKKVSPDGTGLGLYLTKALVDKEGGKIWFSSVEGEGSTFYVNLPIKLTKRRLYAEK